MKNKLQNNNIKGLSNKEDIVVYNNLKPIKVECFLTEVDNPLFKSENPPDLNGDGDTTDTQADLEADLGVKEVIIPTRLTLEWKNGDVLYKEHLNIIVGVK